MPFRPALQVRFRRPMPGTRAKHRPRINADRTDQKSLIHCCFLVRANLHLSAVKDWTGREADPRLFELHAP